MLGILLEPSLWLQHPNHFWVFCKFESPSGSPPKHSGCHPRSVRPGLSGALSWAERSWHAPQWISSPLYPCNSSRNLLVVWPQSRWWWGLWRLHFLFEVGAQLFPWSHAPSKCLKRQGAKNTAETWAAANSQQLLLCSLSWNQLQAAMWPDLAFGEGPERSISCIFWVT